MDTLNVSPLPFRLPDLMCGVANVSEGSFPLESIPPQGCCTVTLGNGKEFQINCNADEYAAARKYIGKLFDELMSEE